MIHLPRCPRVAPGVSIAKRAIWEPVRLALGKNAKLQPILENGIASRFDELSRLERRHLPSFSAHLTVRMQQTLTEDTALVFLCPSGPRLLVALVTRDAIATPQLTSESSDLESLVVDFFHDVRDIGCRSPDIVRQLSDSLWSPVEHHLTGLSSMPKRLVVIPFGWCHFVPFHLLITPELGNYVFEKYDVVYSSISESVSASAESSKHRRVSSVLFVSPFPPELPGSRRELTSIESSGLRFDVLGSSECTRGGLLDRLSRNQYDIIHFACHAMVSYDRPALSHLEFYRGERCYISDLLQACECNGAGVLLTLATPVLPQQVAST